MEKATHKIVLLQKIINAKLSKDELQQVTNKVTEILQREKPKQSPNT